MISRQRNVYDTHTNDLIMPRGQEESNELTESTRLKRALDFVWTS